MAGSDAKLIISGDPSGAIKAIAETKKAFADASNQMAGALNPLSSGLKTFQTALGTVAALLAGGSLFKASIQAANDWNGQVAGVAKSLGITTERASVMAVALDHLGISSDLVGTATLALSRNLASNEQAFVALGVQTRNLTTGAMLPAGEIMTQVNTRLASIKNGVEQNIAGMSVYGKGWGEIRGILKLTQEEMQRAEVRARQLGLVIGADAAAQTKQYKEQMRDLSLVGKALEIQIGEKMLPTLVKLGAWFADIGVQHGEKFALAFESITFAVKASGLALIDMGDALGAVAAQAAALLRGDLQAFKAIGAARDEQAAKNEAAYEKMKADFGKPLAAEQDVGAKRKRLQEDLQTALGDLEKLRAVKAGEANTAIVADDDQATKKRIASAEKLRDALRSAWQQSIEGARQAAADATELLSKAAGTRQSGADKAAEIRRGQMSPEDQNFLNQREAADAADAATQNALLAKLAAQQNRTENAAKLADQAGKDAERASRLAEKIADPETRAKAVERIADAQATAQEAQAKIKEQEAAKLDETAVSQTEKLKEIESQITELQNQAANVMLDVQIDQATANIASIQAQLDALQDKTVTVTVNTVSTGSGGDAAPLPGLSGGGYTGPGGKYQPAGIVHAREFVTRSEVVSQPGALALLTRINQIGMAALKGYADGGLVSRMNFAAPRAPSPPQSSGMPALLQFPGFGSFPASFDQDILGRLQHSLARVALQKGGRR